MTEIELKFEKFVPRYFEMARLVSRDSYAVRRKVGAVVVNPKNHRVTTGYNGTVSGFENSCENKFGETINSHVLHAESNAIAQIAKSTFSSEGCYIFITDAPCVECSKLLIQSGIERVYFTNNYHTQEGVDTLILAGVRVFSEMGGELSFRDTTIFSGILLTAGGNYFQYIIEFFKWKFKKEVDESGIEIDKSIYQLTGLDSSKGKSYVFLKMSSNYQGYVFEVRERDSGEISEVTDLDSFTEFTVMT